MDGGIRRGADVLKALALGADAVLLGRLYAYGLAVGGAAGVEAVIRQLAAELDLTMALAGARSSGSSTAPLSPDDRLGRVGDLVRRLCVPAALATVCARPRARRRGLAVGDGEGRVPPGRTGRLRQPQRLDASPGGRSRCSPGPTAAERKREIASAVPAGTPLRAVSVTGGVATVDLGERFATGTKAASLSARVTQLVLTATSVPGVKSVRLLVKGGTPLGLFPGYVTSAPIALRDATRPDVPPPGPPAPGPPTDPTAAVRALQQRLADLSFLPPEAVDGKAGEQTRFAVIAFQKWQGLGRDGVAGPATQAALATATRPTPRTSGAGSRFEVLLDRQLTLYIENGSVVRTLHVSSGAKGFETPVGRFSVSARK